MSPKKKPGTQGRWDDSSSPSAAEEVGGNEDLIIEILVRLPATSLIRFKLVSKQWSSLISDPHFALNHTIQPNPTSTIPSALFFYNSLTKSQTIQTVSLVPSYSPSRVPPLPFPTAAFEVVKIKILQSCNGLLLIRFSPLTTEDYYNVKIYCVCNPTTKKYKILPQPPETPPEEILDCSLAFDPSQSPHYKVVCVKSLRSLRYSDRDRKIEIYSSELGTWRASTCPFKAPGNTKFDCGVYWNGKLHWLSEYFIVHFDINDESFREIELPPKLDAFYSQPLRYFGECRGHLHMIYVRSPGANRFRVLERDSDTLKWFVKYRVHLSRLITPFPEIVVKDSQWVRYNGGVEYVFSVLCVYKGQKEEDSELVLTIPGKVISYNFHCKTTKVLRELPGQVGDTRDSRYNYATASYFVETLASL